MKFEFISKSLNYLNNEPLETLVVLGNSQGAYIPVKFPKEAVNESDADLFLKALDVIYSENFPDRAEKEKFNKVNDGLKKTQEQSLANKEILAQVSAVTEILISYVISTPDGMDLRSYSKVANFLPHLEENRRYVNSDLFSAPYPFEINQKWPKGTPTIFRFTMSKDDQYIYGNQPVEEMLQKGVVSVVLPKLN